MKAHFIYFPPLFFILTGFFSRLTPVNKSHRIFLLLFIHTSDQHDYAGMQILNTNK